MKRYVEYNALAHSASFLVSLVGMVSPGSSLPPAWHCERSVAIAGIAGAIGAVSPGMRTDAEHHDAEMPWNA
jgi:hypothetical protein